ncbi:MAG: hypothetical protein V4485_01665 [Pseudomonadota bacterium]
MTFIDQAKTTTSAYAQKFDESLRATGITSWPPTPAQEEAAKGCLAQALSDQVIEAAGGAGKAVEMGIISGLAHTIGQIAFKGGYDSKLPQNFDIHASTSELYGARANEAFEVLERNIDILGDLYGLPEYPC